MHCRETFLADKDDHYLPSVIPWTVIMTLVWSHTTPIQWFDNFDLHTPAWHSRYSISKRTVMIIIAIIHAETYHFQYYQKPSVFQQTWWSYVHRSKGCMSHEHGNKIQMQSCSLNLYKNNATYSNSHSALYIMLPLFPFSIIHKRISIWILYKLVLVHCFVSYFSSFFFLSCPALNLLIKNYHVAPPLSIDIAFLITMALLLHLQPITYLLQVSMNGFNAVPMPKQHWHSSMVTLLIFLFTHFVVEMQSLPIYQMLLQWHLELYPFLCSILQPFSPTPTWIRIAKDRMCIFTQTQTQHTHTYTHKGRWSP